MALLSIPVPHDTARLLSSLDVPGDKEDVAYMHVTLVYFGDESTEDDVIRAIGTIYRVTSKARAFKLRASKIAHFDGDGTKVPIICPIESDDLMSFQASICKALDDDGIPYNKKWPDYKPHATLAYAPAPLDEDPDQSIEPAVEWGAHSITLWAGEHGDEKLSCDFALTLGQGKSKTASNQSAAARNAVRAAILTEKLTSR